MTLEKMRKKQKGKSAGKKIMNSFINLTRKKERKIFLDFFACSRYDLQRYVHANEIRPTKREKERGREGKEERKKTKEREREREKKERERKKERKERKKGREKRTSRSASLAFLRNMMTGLIKLAFQLL